jgi:hypothetical protein
VTFIVSDVLDFKTDIVFDFWHDRASFHFLTNKKEVDKYAEIVSNSLAIGGNLVIGTFSEEGPKKCSGLDITQYNVKTLPLVFAKHFDLIDCSTEDHDTPFGTKQNFIFCSFIKTK